MKTVLNTLFHNNTNIWQCTGFTYFCGSVADSVSTSTIALPYMQLLKLEITNTWVSWCGFSMNNPLNLTCMMTSSNGNIFRVTGPLCGEFTDHRWTPLTKASSAELWCFLWSAPEQTVEYTIEILVFETPSRSLWHHCNGMNSDCCEWDNVTHTAVWHFEFGHLS